MLRLLQAACSRGGQEEGQVTSRTGGRTWAEESASLPDASSFSAGMDLALSSRSSRCSFSSLRPEALSWPSTSAALLRLVTALLIRSAASLIFSSRWISCLS